MIVRLLLCLSFWAAMAAAQAPYRAGSRVEDFAATDAATGATRRLSELAAVAAAPSSAKRAFDSLKGASLDVAGRPAPLPETKAFGCTIKRVKK